MSSMSARSARVIAVASGNDNTKVSGSTAPRPKYSRPPSAIGSTKMLISSRYAGNIHVARRRCCSFTFSTTVTWNWRGRKITDSIASTVSANQPP